MLTDLSAARRRDLANRLEARADTIAADVTAEFLERHPDWVDRYGDLARKRGVEDARFHVQFLAGALVAGRAAAFEEYAVWTAGVLKARSIDPRFLIENLEQVGEHAVGGLDDEEESEIVRGVVSAGAAAIRRWEDEGAPTPGGGPPRIGR